MLPPIRAAVVPSVRKRRNEDAEGVGEDDLTMEKILIGIFDTAWH